MIEKFKRDVGQGYINILEQILLFIVGEYFSAMEFLGLYNQEADKYNWRKIGWGVIGMFVIGLLFSPIYLATIIFIFNNLR